MASLAGAGGDEGSSVAGEEAGEDSDVDGAAEALGEAADEDGACDAFGAEDGTGDVVGDADGASLAIATPTMATMRRERTKAWRAIFLCCCFCICSSFLVNIAALL